MLFPFSGGRISNEKMGLEEASMDSNTVIKMRKLDLKFTHFFPNKQQKGKIPLLEEDFFALADVYAMFCGLFDVLSLKVVNG